MPGILVNTVDGDLKFELRQIRLDVNFVGTSKALSAEFEVYRGGQSIYRMVISRPAGPDLAATLSVPSIYQALLQDLGVVQELPDLSDELL